MKFDFLIMHFWHTLPKPIIGLSPMDGVTDAAFRYVADTYGHPSVLFTEFVPVEAIRAGAVRVLDAFVRHRTTTPTIAQIYGVDLDAFYLGTLLVCALGFDGVDINMGCPAKSVAARGAGAGLIRTPDHARAIIGIVKQGVTDWANGKKIEMTSLSGEMQEKIVELRSRVGLTEDATRVMRPVSVKTRTGYDTPQTQAWIRALLVDPPAHITVHGRTLKQLYSGYASWDEMRIAAATVREAHPDTTILGSGDVKSSAEALQKTVDCDLDGVLIGRAAWGNPWIFGDHVPTPAERLAVALVHAQTLSEMLPHAHFLSLRKHLAWYCTGFPGAAELRARLLTIKTIDDVKMILHISFPSLV